VYLMPEDIKKIKVSIPGEKNNLDISQFIEERNNQIDNIKFFINDDEATDVDAWFIIEDPYKKCETCNVPPENVIYFSAEASYPLGWYDDEKKYNVFFSQFSKVISCHPIVHKNFEFEPPYLPWAINANHGSFFKKHYRDYDYFKNSKLPSKKKLLSIICSDQEFTPSHKLRLRFAKELKKHFRDRIDWYGNGINSTSEKWEALSSYKYSIVLEGQSRNSVITEKIGDAYLAGTYPIYWGAPDIEKYFPNCPRQDINIMNLSETIEIIEAVLESKKYENSISEILKAKDIVLNDFNFIYRFKKKFEKLKKNLPKSKITVFNRKHFISMAVLPMHKIPINAVGRIFRRIGNGIIKFSS